jgi:hypothetical protein
MYLRLIFLITTGFHLKILCYCYFFLLYMEGEEKSNKKIRETLTVVELFPELESKDGPRLRRYSSTISKGILRDIALHYSVFYYYYLLN